MTGNAIEGCGCGCGCGSHDKSNDANLEKWEAAPDNEVICHCAAIDKKVVVDAIINGAYTVPLIKVLTGLGREKDCPHDNGCINILEILIELYGHNTLERLGDD